MCVCVCVCVCVWQLVCLAQPICGEVAPEAVNTLYELCGAHFELVASLVNGHDLKLLLEGCLMMYEYHRHHQSEYGHDTWFCFFVCSGIQA